jgi:hypothetical protein
MRVNVISRGFRWSQHAGTVPACEQHDGVRCMRLRHACPCMLGEALVLYAGAVRVASRICNRVCDTLFLSQTRLQTADLVSPHSSLGPQELARVRTFKLQMEALSSAELGIYRVFARLSTQCAYSTSVADTVSDRCCQSCHSPPQLSSNQPDHLFSRREHQGILLLLSVGSSLWGVSAAGCRAWYGPWGQPRDASGVQQEP